VTAPNARGDGRDCSVSMLTANLLVLISAAPIAAALGLAYNLRWGGPSLARGMWTLLDPKVFLATVIPGILAHELIHAIAWSIAARRPLSAIRIGIRWRAVSPYAHPKEPMLVGPYRVGAVMPAVCLGFVPAGLAILLGWPPLMAWSLVFVLAAGGDFVVLWLLRGVPADRLVEDHPTRAGCHVLESELTSSAASLHP
jgi:hypothetical protein